MVNMKPTAENNKKKIKKKEILYKEEYLYIEDFCEREPITKIADEELEPERGIIIIELY